MAKKKNSKSARPVSEPIRRDYMDKVRHDLLPAHASDFVAINMETGQYTVGRLPNDAFTAFLDRWPDGAMYLCRADGGPAAKFHGMS